LNAAGVNSSVDGTETQRAGTSQTTKPAAALTRIDIVLEFKPAPPTWIARTLGNPHVQHNPKSRLRLPLGLRSSSTAFSLSPNPEPRRSPIHAACSNWLFPTPSGWPSRHPRCGKPSYKS